MVRRSVLVACLLQAFTLTAAQKPKANLDAVALDSIVLRLPSPTSKAVSKVAIASDSANKLQDQRPKQKVASKPQGNDVQKLYSALTNVCF